MGIFDKFKLGLNKSSKSLSSGLNDLIFKRKIDESMLNELEDFLIQSVVEAAKETNISVPLVVRLAGTNVELGKEILKKSSLKIISANNLADAATKIIEATK